MISPDIPMEVQLLDTSLSARNILLTLPNIQPKREPLLWMQMDQQQEEATEGIA